MIILKLLVILSLFMNGGCTRQEKEAQITADLKEKYKWDWGRLFSWDMFRLGDFIKGSNEPEYRQPFGINNGKISKNKSLDCTCGLSNLHSLDSLEANNNASANTTSADANNITVSTFPWLVLIYVGGYSAPEITENHPICSGTIINDKVILTAASCLVDTSIMNQEDQMSTMFNPEMFQPDPEDVFVLQANGTTIDLSNENTFTRLEVAKVSYNRNFFYSKIFYEKQDWDIAFLVLRHPLIFNDSSAFTPLCLPTQYFTDSFMEGVPLFSVGWLKVVDRHMATGEVKTTYEMKPYSNLTYAHPKARCQTLTGPNWISDRFFCSNGPKFIEAKFIEAHGAPMMTQSLITPPYYSFVQYGIVSWDFMGMLSQKKNVRVSTNVSGFLQLIEEFSDSVNAHWCSREGENEDPTEDPDWDEGVGLNEPFLLQKLPVSEWNQTTSVHRQYHPLSFCQCGKVADNSLEKYTWQVQLTSSFNNKTRQQRCAGAVINDRVILTAATCVHKIQRSPSYEGKGFGKILERVNPEMLEVHLDKTQTLGVKFGKRKSVILNVKMIIPHVKFRGELCEASEYDIALIVLNTSLNFYDLKGRISPVCLPETTEQLKLDEGRHDVTVLGRHDSVNGTKHKTLQEYKVNMLDKEKCKTLWKFTGSKVHKVFRKVSECVKEKFEFKSRFCGAFDVENYEGPRKADYGSPIMIPAIKNSEFVTMLQVGFISLITYDLMKEVSAHLSNDTNSNPQSIVVYNEIQPLLPFIDYISLVVDAKWCLR